MKKRILGLVLSICMAAAAYQANQQGYHMVADGEGLIDALIAVAVTDEFYNNYPEIIEKSAEHRI